MNCSPNRVSVDLSALVHNLNQVKALLNPGTRIMGVVKSDAYGHGLLPVSKALEMNGVDCLGVAHVEEALEVRKNGIRCPIVVLCGIQTREGARAVIDKNFTPVVFDLDTVGLLADEGSRTGKKIHVQLKVDTGMGRLGIQYSDVTHFLRKMSEYKNIYLEGLTSHLSSADEIAEDFTGRQIEMFRRAIETVRAMGVELPLNNLANSAGVMGYEDSHFDLVRPGIMLYGGKPSPEFSSRLRLRPVMNFSGRILQVRDLQDQTPVSYGRTYYTKGPRKIAIVSAGYGDGIPRSLSNTGKVLVRGRKCDILGRVCMNMMVCDVTGLKGVVAGDEVVFLGTQGDETITGDDMARWGKTISYEIFCAIGQRHTRDYVP
jgi:alanine racemase